MQSDECEGMHAAGEPIEVEPGRFVPPWYPPGSVEVQEYARKFAEFFGVLDRDEGGPVTFPERELIGSLEREP